MRRSLMRMPSQESRAAVQCGATEAPFVSNAYHLRGIMLLEEVEKKKEMRETGMLEGRRCLAQRVESRDGQA